MGVTPTRRTVRQRPREAARERRSRVVEQTIEAGEFRTDAVGEALMLHESSSRTAALRHWSFGQLAIIAGAPPN
jgi:hypothetical protein